MRRLLAILLPTTLVLAAPAAASTASAPGLTLRWGHPHRAYGLVVGLDGTTARVRGTTRRFTKGQRIRVVVRRNGAVVLSRRVALGRTPDGRGTFVASFATRRTGTFTVRAGRARGLGMRVLSAADTSPLAVRLLQNDLAARHYVTSRSGYLDGATQRALLAFRKVNHLARTFSPSPSIARTLFRGHGAFVPRFRGIRHAEADLSRQVLVLVGFGGQVERIYHMSSGKPSTPTILGNFSVYSKTPGTNAHGMIYSSYFVGGYAVHGYGSVPAYAASHGCLRVPPPDAVPIYDWLTYGTPVNVYR